MGEPLPPGLRALAKAWGVQLTYTDVAGRRQTASPQGAIGVLRALGAPLEGPADIAAALEDRKRSLSVRVLEPVTVCWEGERPHVVLRSAARTTLRIVLEDGSDHTWAVTAGERERRVVIPVPVPLGYHEVQAGDARTVLIHAPLKAIEPQGRTWGVFMPAYALRDDRDWGAGDFTSLGDLLDKIAAHGGRIVATLPLLPIALDEQVEPSPYAPVSKLHWNELMLDVEALPEVARCAPAAEALRSGRLREQISEMRAADLVDHGLLNECKRSVLQPVADTIKDPGFAAFLDERPGVRAYAEFRARAKQAPWPEWSMGAPAPDPAEERYHRYVQWAAHRQLAALTERSEATLLFDMPVGTHPLGFDAWAHRAIFANEANAGAPPDTFFTKGQDWGFHPTHPERAREDAYRYLRACIGHLASFARVIRVDHIIGLHRSWWIPPGNDAADGAFVRSRPEEVYAILALESHRSGAVVVGEDLGTVPREVRRMMAAHGILRTYVLQEDIDPKTGPRPIPRAAMATINTHDMPPFAMYWSAADVQRRRALGLFDEGEAAQELSERERRRTALRAAVRPTDEQDVLRATLRYLGRSNAGIVVANLEDLWGETEPVNVPGTTDGNWRRRGRHTLDEVPQVWAALDELNESRRDD